MTGLAEQKRQEAITAAEQITLKAQEAMALERERIMAELKQELGRLVVDTTVRVTGKVLNPSGPPADKRGDGTSDCRLISSQIE